MKTSDNKPVASAVTKESLKEALKSGSTIPQFKESGADGAAVVSAIFASDDCEQASRDLRAVCEATFR